MAGDGQATTPGDSVVGEAPAWWLFRGDGRVLDEDELERRWPDPPPWRRFGGAPELPVPPADEVETNRRLGATAIHRKADPKVVEMVNAAIALARPVIVTGRPGSGKSSLAHLIARELRLGPVLRWPITTKTTLASGLYTYDAFGRARALGAHENDSLGNFVHLGPLGTSLLPYRRPRVLLIDELDKSDVDLPNDLLTVFEDGEFPVNELLRVRDREPEVTVHAADLGYTAVVRNGIVRCRAFPIVVITSNGEREFPAPFMRRALTIAMPDPDLDMLADMVAAHFTDNGASGVSADLIQLFDKRREGKAVLAADQLLNAVHLVASGAHPHTKSGSTPPSDTDDWNDFLDRIWHRLGLGQ
jgi:MoxR-like ATPase